MSDFLTKRDNKVDNPALVTFIIWACLALATFTYIGLAGVVVPSGADGPLATEPAAQTQQVVFGIVAALDGLIALFFFFVLRKRASTPFARLQNTIVAYVLAESVALFGFVSAMTSRNPEVIYPFCGAALVLFAIMFPGFPKKSGTAVGPSQKY